jgi:Ca-activated chloride channel family protein
MSFAAPRLLWLLALAPLAAAAAAALWRRRLRADAAWAARGLWDRLLPSYRPWRLALSVACVALSIAGVVLALSRPRWGGAREQVERRGVDVVFLLDSSLSMAAPDVAPSRLFVGKAMVRRMSQEMPADRVALVQTEGEGMMLSPLTLDGAVLDLLLDTVEAGSLPRPGTELGAGLDTALRLFGPQREKHRALVILSDGEDHGGGLEGATARLKDSGIVVFALGIGTPQGSPIPLGNGDFKRDEGGQVVITRLHEENLEGITRATGGSYLRVASAATDPAPILRRIDSLAKRTLESETVNTREERFQWPLLLAAAALLCQLAVGPFAPARPFWRWRTWRSPRARRGLPGALACALAMGLAAAPANPAAAAALPSSSFLQSLPSLPSALRLWRPHLPAWAERWLYNPRERTAAAIAAVKRGDAKAAVSPADSALRLAPDSPLALYNAGGARLAAGDRSLAAGAVPLLEGAVKKAGRDLAVDASYNLGNARLAAGDFAGAVEAYKQTLRATPAHPDAKFNLELALREQQRQQQSSQRAFGPRGGGNRPRQGERQQTAGQGGSGAAGANQQPGRPPEQSGPAPRQAERQGASGQAQARAAQGLRGQPSPLTGRQPLAGYRDQPEMTAAEAAAVLESVENLERQQRRQAAARQTRQRAANGEDW